MGNPTEVSGLIELALSGGYHSLESGNLESRVCAAVVALKVVGI